MHGFYGFLLNQFHESVTCSKVFNKINFSENKSRHCVRNISIDSRQYIFSLRMNFNDNFADRELHHGANSVNLVEWILIESALFAEISRSSIHSHDLPTCSGLCIHPHGVQEAAPPVLVSRSLSILPRYCETGDSFFYSRFLLFSASSSSSSSSLSSSTLFHSRSLTTLLPHFPL